MPARYTPPKPQRGKRAWEPDGETLDQFVELLNGEPDPDTGECWVQGDEELRTRPAAYRYSTAYKRYLEQMTRVEIQARHYATDENGAIINNAPYEGGPGIIWRFSLAYTS